MTDVYDAPENLVLEQDERGNDPSTVTPRSGDDRRQSEDRRRSSRGLFEHRARRDGIADDRRREERRETRRRLLNHFSWLSRLLGQSSKSSS